MKQAYANYGNMVLNKVPQILQSGNHVHVCTQEKKTPERYVHLVPEKKKIFKKERKITKEHNKKLNMLKYFNILLFK